MPARRCGSKSIDRCSSLRYPHIDRTPHASRKIGAPRGGIFCPGISHDPTAFHKLSLSPRPSSTPYQPWDDCQQPGPRGKKPDPHRIRAPQFVLETLRIIDTGQTRESLRERDALQFCRGLSRYLFDQRLRSHLLEAFSFIEVSIRTQWARQLAYGSRHGEYALTLTPLYSTNTTPTT